MKRTLRRSTFILLFTIAFIAGIAFFAVELIFNARDWVAQPYNAHISGNGGLEQAGAVYDRKGEVLAKTEDGERVYNSDESVRRALLHTVGDNSLNISTAVQSKYRSKLTGYNLIWGLNMPQSMRTSHDITLTVDAQTCKAAYNELQSLGKKGACVVYNYKTGEVICSVSTYSYDPQAPPEINEDNESEYEGVYLDNVLSSSYTPGSIFKIVTAAAALEYLPDAETRTWECTGSKDIGGNDITCVDYHGTVTLKEAMAHSCNIAFAEMAVEIGSEKMNATAKRMGINMSFNVDDVDTAKGCYDTTQATQNQLGWSGVGQYSDKVNPMQMAILCGAIANGGKGLQPTYIKGGSGDLLKEIGISTGATYDLVDSGIASKLDEILKYTADSYGLYFGDLDICAKTGTGETDDEEKKSNGWIVGYSRDEKCPLAFACVVEGIQDQSYGYGTAGAVATAAMNQASRLYK